MKTQDSDLTGLFSRLIEASEVFTRKLPRLCVTMQLICKKRRKEITQGDKGDNINHFLKVEKLDMKDAPSPLEAAVVAEFEDQPSDAGPDETVNIEMDLGLLLEQCFKSRGNNKKNCTTAIKTGKFPTDDLESSENLISADESVSELMLRLENLFEVCTSIVSSVQMLKFGGNAIDSASRADVPGATSTEEQCVVSPICSEHCQLFTPLITVIREEGCLQCCCGFAERASIYYATCVFRSQGLSSVRTIYITLPRSPQVVYPTKLKPMARFNRLPVATISEREQSSRWKEGSKKPWILSNKVSKLLQSNHSIGNFKLKCELTNVLSKLVTPRRRLNSELSGDCEKLNLNIDFPLDALAESEYIQFVEADLDSSMYWYANAGTSVRCMEQKSKKFGSSGKGSKARLFIKRHTVEKFKRRSKNCAPLSVTGAESPPPNTGTVCKVEAVASIPKINTGIGRDKSLLTLLGIKHGGSSRIPEKSPRVPSPLVKLSDVSYFDQDIYANSGCAQMMEVDAKAHSSSHAKVNRKLVTSTNPTTGTEHSFSRADVKKACKSCCTSGYRRRLETSSSIHLLRADVRMPSLLQNTANKSKRQIRMPEKMNHRRRMYGTPDGTSGGTSVDNSQRPNCVP